MEQKLNKDMAPENEPFFQFLSEQLQAKLDTADNNPFIKINLPDKSIPFIVLSDGGVVADITANNPKTILKNIPHSLSADNLGAGFIEVYHGNKTLVFYHIESGIFGKRWLVDNIASALQLELNLYYPGYNIRSH
ncbi:hypothetical protein HDF24_14720 [Mucilaginibacter sp. X4EP1]|uniref:hypothetical protein n=1 Tax=Mucilaginibacter sp. X4EP1 TaxID=2723092 RepID=UPI0021697741|nr:hypothetical protein [Mucilaginibacter sp. X4EP1]MCS3815453.1 hypothetical protein [Mucilaginibacter sp. X4EP1]